MLALTLLTLTHTTVIAVSSTNQLSLSTCFVREIFMCVFVYMFMLLAELFWGNFVMASSRI